MLLGPCAVPNRRGNTYGARMRAVKGSGKIGDDFTRGDSITHPIFGSAKLHANWFIIRYKSQMI